MKPMLTMRLNIVASVILVVLLPLAVMVQRHYIDQRFGGRVVNPDCPWCEETGGEDIVFVPVNASFMRLAAPADDQFLADLLWMRTAYYFGKHLLGDRTYPYLLHLLDLITDLAPRWQVPYLFGAVVLPSEIGDTDDAMYIIEKGLTYLPDNWNLWFFKGFYLWQLRDDTLGAAEAFHTAAMQPGAPVYLAGLSATFATRAGRQELAARFLKEAMNNFQLPTQRNVINAKLRELIDHE